MGLFPAQVSKGTGSGFVWNTDGHVVTNYHVVADVARTNTSCRVRFKSSKEEYAASVVGFDPDHDIAVLYVRAPTSELRPIPVGTSNNLLVGQKVFAIGNPLGYDYTLTSGIISALDRAIQTDDQRQIQNLIQTDAAISPGNSGGPLLDSAGRLIGMNTAVAAGPNASNIGFALPVDTINSIVPEIIRSGTAPRVELGIAALPDQILRANRIERGVMVAQVREGSPAERAGLKGIVPIGNGRAKFGDLIVAVDGVPVNRLIELRAALSKHKLSDTVTLTIQREGQEISLEVPLR
jgi:S1-C subfamily serine protease